MGTRYFWEKWAPRLGPTLTVLVVRLRMHCYYNQATKERRDWCFPTQQTLAEEVGISRWTVMRELKKSEARQFVRVQYRSRYDAARRQTVRISSLYHVAMDDPLVDEDRGRAAALLAAGPLLQQAEDRQDANCGISEPGRMVDERPFTGNAARALIADLGHRSVQSATGPSASKLPPEEEPEDISLDADAVARELVQEHLSVPAAYRLAHQYPAEVIRQKMALVRELKQRQELHNVPGFLRRAIEEDYQPALGATGTEDAKPLLRLRTSASAPPPLGPAPPSPRLTPLEGGRTTNVDVWETAKCALVSDMRPAAFAQWLEPSRLLHYEMGRACVVVPDARIQRYIEQRLKPAIEAALNVSCGGPTNLEVVVEGNNPNS
jgi:hypothetical protein